MSAEEIASLLTIYFCNMTAMNAEGRIEIFSGDAVIYDPVGDPPRQVHKDFHQFYKMLSSIFETIELSKDSILFVRNGVAVKWTIGSLLRKIAMLLRRGLVSLKSVMLVKFKRSRLTGMKPQ
ncbi:MULTISPECIES: hypothetical protein [Cyanophyceae]|uniref:SnoaL-like domain-containing protein n=1 Tax=Stenomitos frigidus AS-A4 TaxID=2933935 RepID=A0ABV0KW31_9CYAN|nr:hypothetical protein [Phormidium sp. FACHB-592]